MSGSNWFLHRNGQQFGPYSWEQLVQLARTGHVEAADLVWRDGEPGSRFASDIEGLMPAAAGPAAGGPARSRGLIAGLAAGVVALIVALVVVIVARGGGDDANTASDTAEADSTEPRETNAPSTTVRRTTTTEVPATTTAATTTAAPNTTPPSTAPSTPPTTAVPITLPVASEADLIAALPPADDLPMGWAVDDGGVTTDFDPRSGLGWGACGLMNNDARALESGAVAHAEAAEMYLPDNGFFYVTLIAFPTPADAAGFISLTADQAGQCQSGFDFSVVEGDGPNQIDIFNDPDADGVVWYVTETDTPMPLSSGIADERYSYGYVTTFETNDAGDQYSATWAEIDQYERYGNIVLITELYGSVNASGFSSWDQPFYEATQAVLMSATDEIRDGVLNRLENLGLSS